MHTMLFLQGAGMEFIEEARAKIGELEGQAEQARQEGDKELSTALQQRLVVLQKKEERLAAQGVWVCCMMPLPSWCVASVAFVHSIMIVGTILL
jgi:DNA-binding protein H-NS